MSDKNIAIIPARGGSKRIPQKNIISFCDKPMIAWTIEAAIASGLFEKVLVSTDSQEIANVSIRYGADVPFLRTEAFNDISPVSEATTSALKQAQTYYNTTFSTVAQLMPNCPLRREKDIISAYKNFQANKFDFQISCFSYFWMNPWWSLKLSDDGKFEKLFPETLKKRSQDLPQLYCPTGAIWLGNSDQLIQQGTFYGQRHTFCEMPWKSAIDIDTYEDLELANAIANGNYSASR